MENRAEVGMLMRVNYVEKQKRNHAEMGSYPGFRRGTVQKFKVQKMWLITNCGTQTWTL